MKKQKKKLASPEIVNEKDIAMDFATKAYQKFDKLIKSIILFGSQAKETAVNGSDIDIVILIDDASINWDQELIAWYREELGKLIKMCKYKKELHINSVKLTTWWQDLSRGDPVVINIIRFGEPLIDFGGFFSPLKILLQQGKIRSTPEAVFSALQRVPYHLANSRNAEMNAIEGVYWAMVDSAHAALMAAKQTPPSPEQIPALLNEIFVTTKTLSSSFVSMFRDIYILHKKIAHGELTHLKGSEIEIWQERAERFYREMAKIVQNITEIK